MRKVFVLVSFLLFACGGGEERGRLVYEVNPTSLSVDLSAYTNEAVKVKLSFLSDGFFGEKVRVEKIELIYIGYDGKEVRREERSLGFVLNAGETKEVNLIVINWFEKLTFPSAYINLLLGRGECFVLNDGKRICRRGYEGEFSEDLASRTCEVRAGKLRLVEKEDGLFEGDGSGIREGRRLRINFSQDVDDGAYVVARCMPLSRAMNFPQSFRINLHTDRGVETLGEVKLSYRGG